MRRPIHSGQDGFDLLNIMVTLGVLAFVLGASVPSVVSTMRTYRRNAAARQVLSELRRVQSVAVTRGDVFGFQWGPDVGLSAGEYRIVRDDTGACSFPATSAPVDDVNVIRDWFDLPAEFPDVTIQSVKDSASQTLGGVMFNSFGASDGYSY